MLDNVHLVLSFHEVRNEGHKEAYPAIFGQGLMHQNLLHSITGCWVVNLGVYADVAGHVDVTVWVNVDVADAIGMAQHRNLGVLLDVSHQGVAASGDD